VAPVTLARGPKAAPLSARRSCDYVADTRDAASLVSSASNVRWGSCCPNLVLPHVRWLPHGAES
jgi:hypothetical protein